MKNNGTLTRASVNRRVFGVDPVKFNTMVRAAQLIRDERPDGIVEETVNEPWWTAAQIENTYTEALDRGQVMGLESPYRGTTDDAGSRNADQLFDEGPNFKGVTPDDTKHWGKLAVLWDPANPNFLANSHVDGPAIAKVNLSSVQIDHCDAWSGNYVMQGHWSGSWQILWIDPLATIPGEAICIVSKSGPWQRQLKVIPEADVPYGGSAQAAVYIDGSDTGEKITITNNWGDFNEKATIPSGTETRVKWFWDELQWVVVGYDESPGGAQQPDVANFNVTDVGLATGDNILNLAVSTMVPQGGITLLDPQTIQCAKAGYYRFSYNIALDATESGGTRNITDPLVSIHDAVVDGWVDPVGSPYGGQLAYSRWTFLYRRNLSTGAVDPSEQTPYQFSAQDVTLSGSGITSIAENGIVRLHVNTPYDDIQIYSAKPSQIHCEFIRTVPAP